jgi:hypothetical protein
MLAACGSSSSSKGAAPAPTGGTNTTIPAKPAESAAVCKELVALTQRVNPQSNPGAAEQLWTTYLTKGVPLIRNKVLRTFAFDFAWTSAADARSIALIAKGQASQELFTQPGEQRAQMSGYYAHQLCYGDALIGG